LKLIIATLPDTCDELVSGKLLKLRFQVTTIASTSGWLRKGMTTLLIGVDDKKVDSALKIIRETCAENKKSASEHPITIFVLKVHEFVHF
jgi:uncharacterized protein YaaQ